jgi:hypothetical protein
MQEFGGINKQRLDYIKAHVLFLQRRTSIAIHPLDRDAVWQMREDLNQVSNGALKELGTNLSELAVLMSDLDGLLSYNVRDGDC